MIERKKKGIIANPLIVLREEFDNLTILFDPETGNTFSLNPIGVIVWKHLDGRHSLSDLADIVRNITDNAPADITGHIEYFVETAIDLGLAEYNLKQ